MNITYNNIESPSNMLTFTEIPNILKVYEDISGTKATFNFLFDGNLQSSVTADSQYYVTFLGETVTNVMDSTKANNKRFFISDDKDSTAASFARALRNCGGIAADFNIIQEGPNIYLIAKTIGSKWSNTANYIQRNIPNEKLSTWGTDGNAYSALWGSKISVDVFTGVPYDRNNYVTTLEKNWYGNECAFDMSPVLSTFSEYGKTIPYYFVMNLFREDGKWQPMGTISGNTAIGYHANQSDKFKYAQGAQMLVNKNRTITLYTYSNVIPYTVLCGQDTGGWSVTISCKDSAFDEIYTYSTTGHRTSSNYLIDKSITVPTTIFNNSYYVDVTVGTQTTRFNVIKPLKATEYYQRVLWRNEYGGISFFDFTGARSESDSVDIETYEKNVFDYYETDEFERKRIYSNDYKKTVSLTSHLMERDGKWIFNSLMRSKKVWTTVNGKTYYIIPKSIEVNEDQTYNNIFTVKLTYEYSDI
jgi:hypothetical protein